MVVNFFTLFTTYRACKTLDVKKSDYDQEKLETINNVEKGELLQTLAADLEI